MADELYTLHLAQADGTYRQYGFHLGTERWIAVTEGFERAKFHLANGCPRAELRRGDTLVAVWLEEET